MILDDPDHTMGSFNSFVTEDTNHFIWFLQSSAEPIMDDYPMSGGKVLNGMARARLAFEAHLWLHVGTLQVRVRDLEGVAATRERYI